MWLGRNLIVIYSISSTLNVCVCVCVCILHILILNLQYRIISTKLLEDNGLDFEAQCGFSLDFTITHIV